MDITIPGLRDRRIAASNEYLDGSERRERRLLESALSGATTPRAQRQISADAQGSARWIYGSGSAARRASRRREGTFDVTRVDYDRPPEAITTIILHSTSGNPFTADDLPPRDSDGTRGNYHRTNEIIAHFLVLRDGTLVYTHDVQFFLNDAGGRPGIDIEFCGRFSSQPRPPSDTSQRLTVEAILAGRLLIAALTAQIPNITRIHPHGQVQRRDREGQCGGVGTRNVCGKLVSCPGPDVWMNVGEWATGPALNLVSKETLPGYPDNYRGQDFAQFNPEYDQGVR